MLSESPGKRSHQDAFPADSSPTASKKLFQVDTSQRGTSEYKKKPLSQWSYWDVVDFFFDGRKGDLDFNFSALSGVEGPELASLGKDVLLRFSPRHGEELYEEVQRRVAQERASQINSHHHQHQHHQHHQQATSSSTTATTTATSTPSTSSSSIFTSPFIFTAAPHLPQPSVVCDAQAPYELRIESVESRAQNAPLRFQRPAGLDSLYSRTPTAALKSHPPPLVALDVREGDEVGVGVAGDAVRGHSAGQSQSQGHSGQEEIKVEPPKKRGPGRPKKPENELKKKKKKTGRLWEFIRNLLLNPETCPSMVRWENAEEGLFRFVDGEKVAKRWGDRKNNKDMNYEKLSRAMRYYYKTHIFEAVIGRRLVYKFGKKATGWQTSNPNFTDTHHATPSTTTTQEHPPPPPQQPQSSQIHRYTDSSQLHHHTDHLAPPPSHHHHHAESQFLASPSPPPPQLLHQDPTTTTTTPPPQTHSLQHHHLTQHIQDLSIQHLHHHHHHHLQQHPPPSHHHPP